MDILQTTYCYSLKIKTQHASSVVIACVAAIRERGTGERGKGRLLHRGQTSEAFFVLLSGILFNVKWKHGQRCIK